MKLIKLSVIVVTLILLAACTEARGGEFVKKEDTMPFFSEMTLCLLVYPCCL